MINLTQPGIDFSDFLEILGLSNDDLIKIVSESQNEDDFIEELCIDECIEQFDLDENTSIKVKNRMRDLAYYKYKKIKEYIRLGKADMLGDYGYIDELKMKELINEK